jgi:hypothetical protein
MVYEILIMASMTIRYNKLKRPIMIRKSKLVPMRAHTFSVWKMSSAKRIKR